MPGCYGIILGQRPQPNRAKGTSTIGYLLQEVIYFAESVDVKESVRSNAGFC